MNKITILLLALVASSVFAQETCESNFLATALDIDLITGDSIDGSAFAFCETLKAGMSCCTAATVAAFQDKADSLIEDLAGLVATRDEDMLFLRNAALGFSSSYDSLLSLLTQLEDNEDEVLASFRSGFASTEETFATFVEDMPDLITAFTDYQTKRGTCVRALINVQTAAYCLACAEPTVFEAALTEGVLTLSTDKNDALAEACVPYFTSQDTQSAAITLYYSSMHFTTFVEILTRVVANDEDAITDLSAAMDDFTADITADDVSKLPATAPEGCTSSSCDFIEDEVIVNGVIQNAALVRGGDQVGSIADDEEETTDEEEEETTDDEEEETTDDEEETTDDEEEEEEEEETVARRLQADDGWNPAEDEAGVTVEWNDNPGNVDASNTSNSAFRTGVIASILALFALLF